MGQRSTAAGTNVWAQAVAPATGSYRGPSSVHMNVAGHSAAAAVGLSGVLFSVSSDETGGGKLNVGVDYSSFAQVYGGNYASRLHLIELPSCALTTPQLAKCRQQTPLVTHRDRAATSVSSVVTLPPAPTTGGSTAPSATAPTEPLVLGATDSDPTDGGDAGTYGATPLKPSGSWAAGGSTGSFTYSYEIPVAGASSGLEPTVGLSYDSGSVDGQTASTEAQSSWAGDGWSTPDSYIERTYASCADSPEGSAAPASTYDRCYDGEILTLSLNGNSTSLVYNSTAKTYTPADDNGEKVKHWTDTGNGSGTYNTDYWTVTDRDGTAYTFGLNELPGWSSGKPATHSVDYEPVYSAHSTDPCFSSSGFSASVCTMAYKWHLDYVTDTHGNAMSYYYKQDTNSYGQDKGATRGTYVRDSYLDHIDHGFRDGGAYGTVPDQIAFISGTRCVLTTCDPLSGTSAATEYPDVPYDLACSAATCTSYAPSYFSTVRLKSIVVQQYSTASSKYLPVDTYNLHESTPATGDGTSPTLWLDSITHTGNDHTAGGSTADIPLPSVSFGWVDLPNRVDISNFPGLYRKRISTIKTEMGETIGVTYQTPNPCTAAYVATASPATNTRSCYPVYWTPKDYTTAVLDWFQKYAVHQVLEADGTGGAQIKQTDYNYTGGAAWHHDDNEVVKAKYRTYGQFRGYAGVETLVGDIANDPQTKSVTTYYRGMGGTVTDSQSASHADTDQLAGKALETTVYKGDGGPVDHSTITSYWVSPAIESRPRTGLPDLTANIVQPAESWTRQAITDGGTTAWRYNETDNSYDTDSGSDTFGLLTHSYSHTVPANIAYDQCGTTTYAPANVSKNLVGLVASQETDSVACGGFTEASPSSIPTNPNMLAEPASVSRPSQVVSATRTYYDDAAFSTTFPQSAAPSAGNVTMILQALDYTGGSFVWQTTKRQTYDTYGRQADTYDANGNKSSITFAVNSVGLTTGSTLKNPKGQTASTTSDPTRGLVLSATDINGLVTTSQYDALGRVTAIWENSRPTTGPADSKYTYTVSATGLSGSTASTLNDSLGYVQSFTIYDSLGRVRQTQEPTPQGGRLITESFYDSRGTVWKENNTYWDPDNGPALVLASVQDSKIPNQDDYTYDGLGRVVVDDSEQFTDPSKKRVTTTVYNGDATTVIPPAGGVVQTTVTDPLGRTTALREYTAAPTAITPANTFTGTWYITGGTPRTTAYGFDGHGLQNTVTDAGSTWTSVHDLLGRTTSQADPDSGTSSTVYDANGNVLQTTDARQKSVSTTYDSLNRKTAEYAATTANQSASNQLASWVYDNDNGVTSVPYPLGHATTSTAYTGGQAYTNQSLGYNSFGESLGETITIPSAQGALGKSYTFKYTYTANSGLPLTDNYPLAGSLPSQIVTHTYSTAFDLPNGLADTSYGYSQGTIYDAYSRPVQETLGMGSNEAYITNAYDPHTSNLTDQLISRTTATPAKVDEQTYTYDPAGNLTRQTSTRLDSPATLSETQCFTYDGLDRLTAAWTANDACQKDPGTAGPSTIADILGSTSAYWTSWTFTTAGQRETQTQHATTIGGTDSVTNYAHDGNNTHQAHTLTSDTTTGGAASSDSYTYDAAGNMSTRTTAATGDQAFTWNEAGQLTTITTTSGGISYIYDADGNLLIKSDPTSKTLYLPGEQITLNTNSSTLTGVRYCALPGGGTVARTGTGTKYYFETADQHGTSDLLLDNTAQTPTWRQFTPYGAPRGTTSQWIDNRGFLNAPTDTTTGLTGLGAREYDPATGSFISLDPLLNTEDPGQLNGYDYSGGDPVGHSDPSGLCTDCDSGATGGGGLAGAALGGGMSNTPVYTQVSPSVAVQGDSKLLHDIGKDWGAEYRKHYRGVPIGELTLYQDAEIWYDICHDNHGLCNPDVQTAIRWSDSANGPFLGLPTALMFSACEFTSSGCGKKFGIGVIADNSVHPLRNGDAPAPDKFALANTVSPGVPFASATELNFYTGCNSFAGNTPVMMADGTSEPIDHVKKGDQVKNALPGSQVDPAGQSHAVTTVHVTKSDQQYVDVTVQTVQGSGTAVGTAHHLYWDVTSRSWTRADLLRVGDLLQTEAGQTVHIIALRAYAASMATYSLGVESVHTFYVQAGSLPVLVHNSCQWTSRASLSEHYGNHGADLGYYTEKDYEAGSKALMCGPCKSGVREKDSLMEGKIYRWNPSTNEFGVKSRSTGKIITYFDASLDPSGKSSNATAQKNWMKQPGVESEIEEGR